MKKTGRTATTLLATITLAFGISSAGIAACYFGGTFPGGSCPDDSAACGTVQNMQIQCNTSGTACCKCWRRETWCNGTWEDRSEHVVLEGFICSGTGNACLEIIDP